MNELDYERDVTCDADGYTSQAPARAGASWLVQWLVQYKQKRGEK